MKKSQCKSYLFWILLSLLVGTLSGLLSIRGMEVYRQSVQKPPFTPPAVVFPIAWSILYILMGIGAARVTLSPDTEKSKQAINLFIAQLTVNFFWSLIFFNLQAFPLAFLWLLLLWGLVAWMILAFRRVDPVAAWLQVPYLIWLTFAAYLSGGVWLLSG